MDRSIVYSARYYFRHGPSRRSHFHLYRIHPDGTGRVALTSGWSDDTNPAISPDGRSIAFIREWQDDRQKPSICLLHLPSGYVQTLFRTTQYEISSVQWIRNDRLIVQAQRYLDASPRLPKGGWDFTSFLVDVRSGRTLHAIPHSWLHALSPDRTSMSVCSDGNGEDVAGRIVDLAHGREVVLADAKKSCGPTVWGDNDTLICVSEIENQKFISGYSRTGSLKFTRELKVGAEGRAWLYSFMKGDPGGGFDFLYALPNQTDDVLVGWQLGGSQDGEWAAIFRVKLATGQTFPWAEADGLIPSPDRRYFLTTRPRKLREIHPGSGSEYVSPLMIGAYDSPTRQRTLVDGMVRIGGFDW